MSDGDRVKVFWDEPQRTFWVCLMDGDVIIATLNSQIRHRDRFAAVTFGKGKALELSLPFDEEVKDI